jgi:hypothetical protein
MTGFIQKYSDIPGKVANAIEHPINTIESVLGFAPHAQPAPTPEADPNKDPYVMEQQRKALDSFRQQQAQPLHAMSKPLAGK